MKIGVNSRIFQNSESGIPYFISKLYTTILGLDKGNEYFFFQTDDRKSLGTTKTLRTVKNPAGDALFDCFLVNRLVRDENIDIFHGASNVLPFSRTRNTKYIVTIHDLSFLIFPDQYSSFFYLYYKEAIRRSLMNADAIAVDSHSTKNDILKYYSVQESKIRVIHLGVDNHFFQQATTTERLVQEEYFFSVTTHPQRKNIHSILMVLSRSKKLQNLKFVIAGLIPAAHLRELRNEILKLGLKKNIIFFGYASEVELINLYQNAVFSVYPSFYEGFGFPILESMACKTPVIASGTSSMIEILPQEDWRINPYDLSDIQEKMERMLELSGSRRKELVRKNLEFAENFSWKKTALEYLRLYEEIM